MLVGLGWVAVYAASYSPEARPTRCARSAFRADGLQLVQAAHLDRARPGCSSWCC
ncbi:MAG: hypothetical protein WKG07_03195 [Hymenobacter sp.]